MPKEKKTNIISNKAKIILEILGVGVSISAFVFWAGWYTHSCISSVEFHEKEMQLYNLHQQIDDSYKNEIKQLEADKRYLEKELFELRKELFENKTEDNHE